MKQTMRMMGAALAALWAGTAAAAGAQTQAAQAGGAERLAAEGAAAEISANGAIARLALAGRDIPMTQNARWAGPSLSIVPKKGGKPEGVRLRPVPGGGRAYRGSSGECELTLRYSIQGGALAVDVEAANKSASAPFAPERLSLLLGIDTYMSHYPQWSARHFPTFLKTERAGFFWGYAMSPAGGIVGIFSPDPVDSWHLEYNNGRHRIYGIGLDLVSAAKRRAEGRAPASLAPGAVWKTRVFLEDVPSLEAFPARAAARTGAVITLSDRYTLLPCEPYVTTAYRPDGSIGRTAHPAPRPDGGAGRPGDYGERPAAPPGKASSYRIIYRRPWSWYLDNAREWVLKAPQKAGSHIEGWYGFFAAYQWRRLRPAPAIDRKIDEQFENLFGMMYPNAKTMAPHRDALPGRIQNHGGAAALYADRYRALGRVEDLEKASKLIDFIIRRQSPDGAYRTGRTHYTSVIYLAKYLADAMASEKERGEKDPVWKERFERHYASVERAVDELARKLDDIQTEGEMTFEDGMVACTCAQLADWALRWAKPENRGKYVEAAEKMAAKHRCLSQKVQPDGRMNGASLRFWESQYDVLYCRNMMTSPHGWSAWRLYGLFDLYRLTGKPGYLRDAMNGLGACANLINTVADPSGAPALYWAYQADDLLETAPFTAARRPKGKGNPRGGWRYNGGPGEIETLLQGYRPMISDWFRAPPDTMVFCYSSGGGSCDNDVHEIFKCVCEKAVRTTFAVFGESGAPEVYNGSAAGLTGGRWRIVPAEGVVGEVHVNTRRPVEIEAAFPGKPAVTRRIDKPGMVSIFAGAQ